MIRRLQTAALAALCALAAAGCGIQNIPVGEYIDKVVGGTPAIKPAALVEFKPTATPRVMWQASAGAAERFIFTPLVDAGNVTVASAGGQITRMEAATGKVIARWDAKTRLSGGVGGNDRLIMVGTTKGEVLAFDANGKELWRTQLSGEVLSAPKADQGIVVVRTGDSRLFALDAATGARKWAFQRALPPLTLRTNASVVLYRGGVFAGLPGGRLVALTLTNGNVGWETAVALPKGANELERIADVASAPVLDARQCCAAAYQGRAGCFDLLKGSAFWTRDISSISGLTMDNRDIYIADDKSAIIALEKTNGTSLWKQDKLYGRQVSTPVLIGRYVAVGDYQGYVHFLLSEDGSFAARMATDGSAIVAQPLALDNAILVQTRNGGVYAITIGEGTAQAKGG